MGAMRAVVLVCLAACGGDDGGGAAQGTVKMLNGASPGSAQPRSGLVAPAPSDGNWQVSPTKIVAPVTELNFQDETGSVTRLPVDSCSITFDLKQPALAQNVECPFQIPAGTYTGVGFSYGATYDLTIDDATNGMFTDPTAPSKIVTTAPTGGAQPVTVPNARASLGGGGAKLNPPLVVNDGDTVTVSVLLSALQSIQVSVQGGQAALGVDGSGSPGFPDAVAAVGTPARVTYYVNGALGSPYSVNASSLMEKGLAVSVLYSTGTSPAFLGFSNGHLSGCPSQTGFVFPAKNNGYLGLDSTGTLGWAGYSDMNGQSLSALMRMHQVDTKGGTTTFECMQTTTDPMPAGDSFSSGAPAFATPTHTESMTLVVN